MTADVVAHAEAHERIATARARWADADDPIVRARAARRYRRALIDHVRFDHGDRRRRQLIDAPTIDLPAIHDAHHGGDA